MAEQHWRKQHPSYAATLCNLAELFHELGRYAEAEPLYLEAIEIRRGTLGKLDPYLAYTLNCLAELYRLMGRHAEAETRQLEAVRIRRTALGEDHPEFAESVNNLAALYRTMGRLGESESLYQQAIEIRRTALGESHPDLATSLNDLALLYDSLGRYAEAEPLYLQAVEIWRKALGEQHSHYAAGLNNLAMLYDSMGRYADAEPLYQQAMENWRTMFGEQHPNYGVCLNNLAELYRAVGQYELAEPLYQKESEICRATQGEASPGFATSLNNRAALYRAMGKYDQAEPLYLQALEIRRATLGEDHSGFAESLNNVALYLSGRSDTNRSCPTSRRLNIQRAVPLLRFVRCDSRSCCVRIGHRSYRVGDTFRGKAVMTDTTSKPVIFLAFANDRDDTVGCLLNLPDEERRLRDVLKSAERAGLCEVEVRSNCTAGDIFKVFQDPGFRNRIAIFHYGGHANGYLLLLESADGQTSAADAGGFAAFLAQQQGLQLVFLNGCSTQEQTQGLLDANVSAVISTSRSIDDQVATDFSVQFYQGLAGGATIRTAYSEAAAAARAAKGGDTRALYFGDVHNSQSQLEADRWPWNLYVREGSESADQWNLPEAVNDPLFGLPPLPEQDLPETPYRHLSWFTREHADVFFGRGHQIRKLYDRLTAPGSAPIVLFYGQSGVGKSSILDAGLIPRLERDHEVRYLRRTEGGLLDTLQLAFIPEAVEAPLEMAWRVKEKEIEKPLIVFLDQVEECYTRPIAEIPDELDRLLRVVGATFHNLDARPQGKLVLGFRKEWLPELEGQLAKYELPSSRVFLERLDRNGIIEVVQGPDRSQRLRGQYGLTVEDGLAEIIADNMLDDRGSAIAPTLQILLTKMWTKAREVNYETPHFSLDLYQQLKREGILLRDFLNQQLALFGERLPEAVESGLVLDILALHTTPLGTASQCNVQELQQRYAHQAEVLPDLLRHAQDLHLLTVAVNAEQRTTKATRLAHDTLAPLVREQFDVSDKPGQRARRILNNRAVDWKNDRVGIPLDDADLKLVEQGLGGTCVLNATERRLLEASRESRLGEQRSRMRRKVFGLSAMVVVAVLAIGLGLFWYTARLDRANKLLVDLSSVDEGRVFHVVAEMKTEFAWLRKDLEADVESDSIEPERKTRALIALAANDPSRMDELWRAFKNFDEPINRRRRFLAGLAIARYDRQLNRFSDEDVEFLANELLASATKNQRNYRNYLSELSGRLILPLEREFYAPTNAECGIHAAMALLDFANGDVNRIVELATNANPTQFNDVLFPGIEDFDRSVVLRKLVALIDNDNGIHNTNDQKSTPLNQGKRRAGAAIALLRLGSRDWDRVFDALRIYDDSSSVADPEPLTQFIHGCKARGLRAATLIEAIERACALRKTFDAADRKREDSVLFALLLSLGEFDYDQLDIPDAERERFVGRLQQLFATDPSSAIHGATRWLMQHWEFPLKEKVVPFSSGREWYTIKLDKRRMQDDAGDSRNAQDGYFLTFIVFEPGVYPIGSFQNSGRDVADYPKFDEHFHMVRITRRFAVLDREITALEFEESGLHEPATQVFENEVFLGRNYTRLSKPLDRPMINVCWYEAVKFCRWLTEALSESDVVEPEQAYQHPDQLDLKRYPVDPVGWGLESRCNWPVRLECHGFRLPTEAEWEIACRAGAGSLYSFGSDEELLMHYHGGNAGEVVKDGEKQVNKWHVVQHFRPNLRGLFGAYGRVREWCHDIYGPYLTDAAAIEVVDPVGPPQGPDRAIRGGRSDFGGLHSSNRNKLRAGGWSIDLGFRIAQTLDELVQP